MPSITITHAIPEEDVKNGAPKERKRDLSRYTVPHLKKMRAHAEKLIEQIDDALAARTDNADASEVGRMSAQQFERWSRQQLAKADEDY